MTYVESLRREIHSEAGPSLARLIDNMSCSGPEADEIADLPEGLFAGVDVRALNCFYLPSELGGQAAMRGSVARCVLGEMLGYADAALTIALPGPGLILAPLLDLGSEDQRRRYLGLFDRAEPTWGAFAITEPTGGSDATHLSTTATPCDRGFRLDGEKCFIGNGGRASFYVVYASTDPERGQFGIRPFLVDAGTPGLYVEDDLPMLGLRAVRVAQLRFEDCRVPAEALLGPVDGPQGAGAFLSAQRSWEYMRPGLSAVMVGSIHRMLDELERVEGAPASLGRAIADLAVRVRPQAESVRLLSHHAAALFDAGSDSAAISSMAKAAAAGLARETAAEALLTMSQWGFGESKTGRRVGRWARDVQAFELLEGTTEVHQLMVTHAWGVRSRRRQHRLTFEKQKRGT
jgi:acyl-CoA dehydrogenase